MKPITVTLRMSHAQLKPTYKLIRLKNAECVTSFAEGQQLELRVGDNLAIGDAADLNQQRDITLIIQV